MRIQLASLFVLTGWLAFSSAMLMSHKLWFNDLYLLVGYAVWSFVGAKAFMTTGNKRLFWLTVTISLFVFSSPSLVAISSGWLCKLLAVEGGGTQFGKFGNDILFSHSTQNRGVHSTLFWTFQKINAPLVLGVTCATVRVLADRWKVLAATVPLLLGWCIYLLLPQTGMKNVASLLFGFYLAISLTFPINSSLGWRNFWIGFSSATAIFAFAIRTEPRFVYRNLSQAFHALSPDLPDAANGKFVGALSEISVHAFSFIFALLIGLACRFIIQQERHIQDSDA